MEIIPVINCLDFKTAAGRIAKAETFLKKGDWLHVDVADGIFTFHKSWRNPAEWMSLDSKLNLEVHLMVEHPEHYIEQWIKAGAKRIIVHAETLTKHMAREIARHAAKKKVALMLASNPHTAIAELWPLLPFFSGFQVLAVDPGPAGQKIIPIALEKAKFLRNFAPNAIIEVDGGVVPETMKAIRAAGADIAVAGSYIFNSRNPKKAYRKLKNF